jgi:primase-polymerase (primpol)-like protein
MPTLRPPIQAPRASRHSQRCEGCNSCSPSALRSSKGERLSAPAPALQALALAPALRELTKYRQFIIYKAVPSATRPGRTEKLPCDYRTGHVASAHDPAIWTDADVAIGSAAIYGDGYGIGFVLIADRKLFCLDIDNCLLANGQWSDDAVKLCGMFPGAAIERSRSDCGLHIWGKYSGPEPSHSKKNTALGIELYTSGRFIALGRPETAIGDAATNCTLALESVIAAYFPLKAEQDPPEQEWTTEPCPEWSGPSDDGLLIHRAIASQSVNNAFGGKASFADLWNANGPALARAYPDDGGREYDCSSADAALAQHLAFWTGKDCERIRRLMEQSKLKRDKWERADYLPRTILSAVARQIDVYADDAARRREQIEESMRIGDGADEIPPAGTVGLDEMLARFVFVREGQQVVDLQRPRHPSALADCKAALRASTTTVEVKGQYNSDGTPKTKTYETAILWEKSPERKQVFAVTFKAGGKRLIVDPHGKDAVNIWTPPDRSIMPGDPSLFLEHVDYLLEGDAGRFVDWLAHIEQKPGELPHFGWIHISDKHGTGRNWLAGFLCRLWPGYTAINFDLSGTLRTGFNDRLSCKLIAVVDEIQEGGSNAKWDNAETMKRLVTEEYRTINQKYGRIREEFNACRWLIFSNHISALPLDEHDRRFNVVRNEEPPRAPEYYARLYAALKDRAFIAGVAHLLQTRDLSGFNPGEHAVMNEAKEAVVAASRSEADEILNDLVERWPVDVILTSTLGELITGQPNGKVTGGYRHALERRGIRPYKQIRVEGHPVRVSILRNFQQWKDADAGQIRAALERGPKPSFGGARSYLDNLTAESVPDVPEVPAIQKV